MSQIETFKVQNPFQKIYTPRAFLSILVQYFTLFTVKWGCKMGPLGCVWGEGITDGILKAKTCGDMADVIGKRAKGRGS